MFKKTPEAANQLKTRIIVEFVENGFTCVDPCKDEWLEIKYKTDKTAGGKLPGIWMIVTRFYDYGFRNP